VALVALADGAELLQAVANGIATAADGDGDGDAKARRQRKRDVVLSLERDAVLLAADGREPLCRPAPTRRGGMLIAFSDAEAADAWARRQHPGAPPCAFAPASELHPGDVAGRERWLSWLERYRALGVAINPEGPLGTIVYAAELENYRQRLLRRPMKSAAEHPWLDPAAREAERRRGADVIAGLAAAADAGDVAESDRLGQELLRVGFGSLVWESERLLQSGRARLRAAGLNGGADRREAIERIVYGSGRLGLAGDPYRAIDGLLEAGEILLGEAHPDLDDEPGWSERQGHEIAEMLAGLVPAGYRTQEASRFAEASGPSPGEQV
jgi:hypothetical protein